MTTDTVLALAIVAAAVFFLVRRAVRARRGAKSGCANCGH